MLHNNVIQAQKVQQNNQEFYVAVFAINRVLEFTKFTERLIVGFDDSNIPIYNPEIQRRVENTRVEKIADFLINDPDALFPTNIVVSIPSAVIESINNISNTTIEIGLSSKVFSEVKRHDGDVYLTVIDGQHRIRGIERAIYRLQSDIENINRILANSKNDKLERKRSDSARLLANLMNLNLIVTFFIDPTLEFQAMVFSTINRTQKSVPQSLVYSLFGLTENDSPQKTALQIVLALNSFEKSPFFDRVKLHGGNYGRNQSPPLTQAMMVKSIIDLICTNLRDAENDRFRPRTELLKNASPNLPFRKYYAQNNDNFITDILFSFFTAVKDVFSSDGFSYWEFTENTKPANILQTTVGYQALLDILVDILKEIQENEKDTVGIYKSYLGKATNLNFENVSRYPFTSKSRKILYYDLSLAIWPAVSDADVRISKLYSVLNR
ncbi:MAG: hypothetical protein BGO70_14360 [Bacteroidetes bacterium 43-93]|uniref:DGQHR domain-containing protein n=1 Tax=uncultured Dysgonomonas sp. TaxID=206096 RepID=UPI00092629DD|nr:DGQHR domain-containing protein [uncultured Dysgonomonas sp.]MBN9485526.1 DGQHR domain-containing protein [Bacteroidota bacterium]OJW99608.1 MAG: hypothetical protein BGO70_14360 [Bacteroidetes bacterium 43-93]